MSFDKDLTIYLLAVFDFRNIFRLSNSHFDSERAHPGRSAQRNPNAAGYSAPFSLSGAAAAWKAALHARQNENCCFRLVWVMHPLSLAVPRLCK
jgi:hypothetical protein